MARLMPGLFLALASLSASVFGGGAAITVGLANLYGLATTALGGFLFNLGFSIGLNFLIAALRPGPEVDKIQQIIRSTVSPRLVHLGRVKVAGTLAFLEAARGALHGVGCGGHGLHDGVEAVYIDDNLVTINLDGGGNVTSDPYADGTKSRILWRLGNVPETHFSELTTEFPTWTSAHRGDGLFSFYYTQWAVSDERMSEVFPSAAFTNYSFVLRGRLNYDWSDGQDIDDETTWSWSDNLARCILWYMMHADGARLPMDMLTTPLAIAGHQEAIADCAQQIALKAGGTEDRYRYWGSYSMEERPADVLPRIMVNGLARLELTSDGGLTIRVAKWVPPTVTIGRANIRSLENIQPGRSILDTANVIRAKYYSADHRYQAIDIDPWRNEPDIALRGPIDTDVPLGGTPSHAQARRVAKIYASKVAPDWVFTINTDLSGCAAIGEPFFNFEYQLGDLEIECPAEIQDARIILDADATVLGFQIQAISADPTAYDWDAETEEGEAPLSDESIADDDIEDPENFSTSIEYDNLGGVAYPYVELTVDPPEQDNLRIVFEYRADGSPSWTGLPNTDNATTVRTPILGDGDYEFRVYFRTITLRPGPPSATETETIVGNPTVPTALTAFTATGGNGFGTFGWTVPNDVNAVRVVVYLTAAGGSLNKVTDQKYTYYTSPNATVSGYVQGVAGVNDFTNADFAGGSTGWTLGTGWTVSAGTANAAAGSQSVLTQNLTMAGTTVQRIKFDVTARSAGQVRGVVGGGGNQTGAFVSTTGTFLQSITSSASPINAGVQKDNAFVGSIDNMVHFQQVAGMAPQGVWDIRAFTSNGSGVESASAILVSNVTIV